MKTAHKAHQITISASGDTVDLIPANLEIFAAALPGGITVSPRSVAMGERLWGVDFST